MNLSLSLLIITLVIAASSAGISYGASLDSPFYQLQNEIDPKDIQCNKNRIPVFRTNGNIACVNENTAHKLNWKINIFEIWNPIPEDQRDGIAEILAKGAGDKVIEKISQTKYVTEKGSIYMSDGPSFGRFAKSIEYDLNFTIIEPDKRKEFIYGFMNKASLEHHNATLFEKDYRFNGGDYKFRTDRGFINFDFSAPESELMAGDESTTITILSWSNNPNPVVYVLSEQEAAIKAFEYGQQTEFSFRENDGEKCKITIHDKPGSSASKHVLWGEPYYELTIGSCYYPSREGLDLYLLGVLIDGTTGKDISSFWYGIEG